MKKLYIMSLLALTLAVSTCSARFTMKNTTGAPVTLLLDYAHHDYFEYLEVPNNNPFFVTFGLKRIIAWKKGKVRKSDFSGLDGDRLPKIHNYPPRNSFVIERVTGTFTHAAQTFTEKPIEKAMHGFHQVVPSWRLISVGRKALALWEAALNL